MILISSLAVGVKRLHDRNKSGWYLVLFYIVPGILVRRHRDRHDHGGFHHASPACLALVAFAIGVWAFVELGCLRGTIGANQYGPDPVAPQRPSRRFARRPEPELTQRRKAG